MLKFFTFLPLSDNYFDLIFYVCFLKTRQMLWKTAQILATYQKLFFSQPNVFKRGPIGEKLAQSGNTYPYLPLPYLCRCTFDAIANYTPVR